MRVALTIFGVEVWAVEASAEMVEPCDCDEVEPDPRGDSLSIPIGFQPSIVPEWEKPLNRYDEPSEDTEDT